MEGVRARDLGVEMGRQVVGVLEGPTARNEMRGKSGRKKKRKNLILKIGKSKGFMLELFGKKEVKEALGTRLRVTGKAGGAKKERRGEEIEGEDGLGNI